MAGVYQGGRGQTLRVRCHTDGFLWGGFSSGFTYRPTPWRELLKRSFGADGWACPHCGQRLRLLRSGGEWTELERGANVSYPWAEAHPSPRVVSRGAVDFRMHSSSKRLQIKESSEPASMARDAEARAQSGWKMTVLWTVDLFPQTHHVEAVGLFKRGL